jgi:uncharacterized Zn finger protein
MSETFWFDPESLHALCEDGPWMRGKALLAQGTVSTPQLQAVDEGWQLQGVVQGAQQPPYAVAVTMAVMPDGQVDYWRGTCECPVGRQCKHAVALMLKAARLPVSEQVRAASAPRKPSALSAEPAWQLRAALAGLRAQFL